MGYTNSYASPFGKITVASDGEHLVGLWFENGVFFGEGLSAGAEEVASLPVFEETFRWLDLYFAGKIPDFTPPLSVRGSDFQKRVCELLLEIPYGETSTYGDLARRIAKDRRLEKMSAQAVGGAVGRNPVSIIIPCHRVIGANGGLVGYAGGIERKRKLLELEAASISTETTN